MNKIEKFKNYYKEVKKDLDEMINGFNKKIVNDDNKILKDNLELFAELNSNGKLVRGTLVNLGYYLLKDNKEYSNYLSVAYEVFQTAILVHDDVIDNDEKRRGKDTIHYANMKKYSKYDENVRDLGNNIAIKIEDNSWKIELVFLNPFSLRTSIPKVEVTIPISISGNSL